MTSPIRISAASLLAAGLLAGCGSSAQLAVEDGQGPQPQLPAPSKSLIPTLNIAPAVGWKDGAKPTPAAGLNVTALATGLQHPRWVYTLPNGDVLVAESEAPAKPDDAKGIRGWVQKKVMKRAGSGAAPSANRITLLRDADGDGVAEVKSVFVQGLNSPIGMALAGDTLYVADTDAVMAFPYKDGDLKVDGPGRKLTDLPAGTINHHWTKSLIASADGSKLYVGIGSNSNVAENGLDAEKDRARVWEIDTKTGEHTVYGSGLRNPVGLAWEPSTQALWVAVNERDELGSDLVPDYITSIKPGAFYGWPFSYYGQHVDARAQPQDAALVASAIPPDYAVGPHTASLGLSSSKGETLGASYEDGMFVGQHGSWNRKPRSGYKVIFVPFKDGRPSGKPVDVLTGFLTADGDAQGRPVGVTLDRKGALLVADDVGNTVWRVSGKDMATQTATVAP